MALKLRRGTDAERQTIIPLQGELIYTTDTKKLYVGDGSTEGGVLVGPISQSDLDLLSDTTPQLGGNLDLNGNNIVGTGNINIDGTITATGNIGLGTQEVTLNLDGAVTLAQGSEVYTTSGAVGNVKTAVSSAAVVTLTITRSVADFQIGDTLFFNGATLNVQVQQVTAQTADDVNFAGLINSSLRPSITNSFDLGSEARQWREIFAEDASIDGEVRANSLIVSKSIEGADSAVVYDAATDTLSVSTVSAGKVTADLVGSVFSDDSTTILVDSVGAQITGRITTPNLVVNKESTDLNPGDLAVFNGTNNGDLPFVEINIAKNTLASPTSLDPEDDIGGYRINAYANGEYKTVTALLSVLTADANVAATNPKTDAYLVVGNNASSTFYFFQGDGIFKAPTAIKTGAFEDEAARDAAIPNPEAGMIILLTGRDDSTGGPTFQGYDGNGWRDLST